MTPKQVRQALGMTQRQFAEALDVASARTVRGWESGEYVPGRRSLKAIERLVEGRKIHGADQRGAVKPLSD